MMLQAAKVWWIIASNALQEAFVNRWTNSLFFIGKAVRFAAMLVFLSAIQQNTAVFGTYSTDQMIIFFLTYQLIDLIAQILYRGVYLFSQMVRTGEFDFFLIKPINPLFRALTWKPDINDILFLIPTILITWKIISVLQVVITFTSLLWYLAIMINSFLIITALHILVLTIGILTTEVDGVIWMYRDTLRLGQFPVSVYQEPLRFILFFVLPVGMMITIPSQILFHGQPSYPLAIVFLTGITSFWVSIKLWNWGLRQYSSASS